MLLPLLLDLSGAAFYTVAGTLHSQVAQSSGSLSFTVTPKPVVPSPVVRGRSIDWNTIVRMADGDAYAARRPYPVYVFGGGEVTRRFIEYV